MRRAVTTLREGSYDDRDAWLLESPVLRLTVMQVGGHLAEIVLKGDRETNPLWRPARRTIDPTDFVPEVHETLFGGGPPARLLSGLLGHNVCFPYWGRPSEAEYRCGMSFHGETGVRRWSTLAAECGLEGGRVTLTVDLPESATRFERTLQVFADISPQ